MSAPASGRSGLFNVNAVLEAAYARFKRSAPKCLPLMMVAVLCAGAADLYWLATGHRTGSLFETRDARYYLLQLGGFLLYIWLITAFMLRMQALAAGNELSLSTELQQAAQRWPNVVVTWLAATVLVLVGLLALIAPGIYLSVCLVPLLPVLVIENLPPVEAIRRCLALVRPLWAKVLAALVIALLIVLICLFAAGLLLAMFYSILGSGNTPLQNALNATSQLFLLALAQIFFYAVAVEIYSSAKASA
jgi:magnesium-transporting ATPase (P-type)